MHLSQFLYISTKSLITQQLTNQYKQIKTNLVAAAILGGYFGLFILVKIKGAISGGSSVEEVAAPVAAVSSSAGAIPDIDSEEFGAFLESEENIMKLVDSMEK